MKWFGWLAVIGLLTFILYGLLSWWLFPASHWFTVSRVVVLQSIGDRGYHRMEVDRKIHRTFSGTWQATVRSQPGNTVVCQGGGDATYRRGTELPDPVDLRWWLNDPGCRPGTKLAPGEYFLSTTWTVRNPWGILPDKTVNIDSNVFTVE